MDWPADIRFRLERPCGAKKDQVLDSGKGLGSQPEVHGSIQPKKQRVFNIALVHYNISKHT